MLSQLRAHLLAAALVLGLVSCNSSAQSEREEYETVSGAVGRNDIAQLVALLRSGADPDAPDSRGAIPLVLAATASKPAIVAALLAAGANPNLTATHDPFTALMGAATRSGDAGAEIVAMLLKAGADPCPTAPVEPEPQVFGGRYDGLTALEIARLAGNQRSETAIALSPTHCLQ